jgi:hypothetical protein
MSSTAASPARADEQTAFEIGVGAYEYLYPLVLMDLTRRQMTNVERVGELPLRGPMDAFVHVPAFPPATFRDVVRPNFDTLYSVAWLDLHTEPRVISAPAAGDLYYLLPLYDMWTEVFASPGSRTTGNGAIDVAVCPPGWSGELPGGVRAYEAPTPVVWVIGRTEASVETYDRVHAFQAGLTIRRLSEWGAAPRAVVGEVDPAVDATTPPMRQASALDAAGFFSYAAELLAEHPPHASDYPMLDLLEQIGLRRGEPFDLGAAGPVVRHALERAVPVARKTIADAQATFGRHVDGWSINVDVFGAYGVEYLKRAAVALAGLGANLSADAVYPFGLADADGEPFHGSNRYVWHLEADELPPVRAFWSLTMYDAEGFPVPNELDRCAIGDRDDLHYGADGSLDVHVQNGRPDAGTANWLPAPEGAFGVAARLYWPKPEVLDGTWTPPPIRKAG